MDNKKLVRWVLVALAIIGGGVASCVNFTSEDGVELVMINEMDQQEFDLFKSDISLVVQLLAAEKMADDPELAEKVRGLIENGRALVTEGGLELAGFARQLVAGVDDTTLRILIELGINRIQQRGGFSYVEDGGEQYLTDRGVELINALLDGLELALPKD
jgi:hypothetical protein